MFLWIQSCFGMEDASIRDKLYCHKGMSSGSIPSSAPLSKCMDFECDGRDNNDNEIEYCSDNSSI